MRVHLAAEIGVEWTDDDQADFADRGDLLAELLEVAL
jgi:hypothetical protein